VSLRFTTSSSIVADVSRSPTHSHWVPELKSLKGKCDFFFRPSSFLHHLVDISPLSRSRQKSSKLTSFDHAIAIHNPSAAEVKKCGYVMPIVDHKEARVKAIEVFKKCVSFVFLTSLNPLDLEADGLFLCSA